MSLPTFSAPVAAYAERVAASFGRQGIMHTLGARLVRVKPGRTLMITRDEVHAEDGGQRTLVAIMQQTLMVMHGKPDSQ